jgi:GNAT superfamily N-acetyltransferase
VPGLVPGTHVFCSIMLEAKTWMAGTSPATAFLDSEISSEEPEAKMIAIRAKEAGDREWVEAVLERLWGSRIIAVHGRLFDAAALPALIAGDRLGLLTYTVEPPTAEIVTLNALEPRQGIGSALVAALAAELAARGVGEIHLTTTNDNLDALRFYQRRGFRLAALRPGAVDAARHLKPAIPVVGNYGIARHDEIELVLILD